MSIRVDEIDVSERMIFPRYNLTMNRDKIKLIMS